MHRLLYISASSPVPSKLGPARRNFHVLEQLSRRFEVSLLTTGTEEQARLFDDVLGSRVRAATFVRAAVAVRTTFASKAWRTATNRCDFLPVLCRELRVACREVFETQQFDAVVLSHVLLRGLPIPAGIAVIGDTHNVEFDVLRRMSEARGGSLARRIYASAQWRATRTEESRCANAVDLLLATSDRDAEIFIRELGIQHTAVVANGIDLSEFQRADTPGLPLTMLFAGLMSYYPNQQGIRWFLTNVLPLVLRAHPRAKLVVAGAAPPQWLRDMSSDIVEVTGSVRDMRPYLERASVVVAPLWHGGGTRVKILEAMATGRPVVSTAIGCEGLGAIHDDSILIANDPAQYAEHVVRLFNDTEMARRIADGGFRHVTLNYDWEQLGTKLCNHVHSTLRTRHGRMLSSPGVVA
jgi:polysaccharide biosynthesis protein PslH